MSVVGDVTIAVWLGDHNMGERIHSRPSFAYAFHTGTFQAFVCRHVGHNVEYGGDQRLFQSRHLCIATLCGCDHCSDYQCQPDAGGHLAEAGIQTHLVSPRWNLADLQILLACAAFIGDGLERVTVRQLDVFEKASLPSSTSAQALFFMDVTFDDDEDAAKATWVFQHTHHETRSRVRVLLKEPRASEHVSGRQAVRGSRCSVGLVGCQTDQ